MSAPDTKTAIIIAGPTAVGKTSVAIRLAQALDTEILSADSRQCYRELNIGVAKPTPEECRQVRHHFISSHSVTEDLNAAAFEQYALNIAADIFTRHSQLVVCGGTGLYLQAFTEGINPMPTIPEIYKQEAENLFATGGTESLASALLKEDPVFAAEGEMMNPQRMMRALSFIRATGSSIRHYQRKNPVHRPFHTVLIGLELPRQELYERINMRVDDMIAAGLPEEVRSLQGFRHLHALKTVGYSEMFDYLDGKFSLDQAIALIKQHTRNYAKRQMTWFKNQSSLTWFHPGQFDAILDFVQEKSKLKT